ncbi:uncharacterized protein LOC143617291 [Bidens hawaiensis]|uniref:uncharacterized protein LOC143617291 n=1 Tax=Bidens hawaiensis TaxID=980011 RepID=UPI00404B0D05
MAIIQQAVHDTLFSRIAAASTSKETWEILKMEFQGDSQIKVIKLQGLRRDFKNLCMKEGEPIGEYFSMVMTIVNQKRSFGEEVADQTIVEKILCSLTPRFDYVVPSIEVSHDLSLLTPVKLMGSLQSHEERINSRHLEKTGKNEEQALQVMQDRPQFGNSSNKGRGLNVTRGRGGGRSFNRSRVPQFSICKKYGHMTKDCWYNDDQQVNVAVEEGGIETNADEQRLKESFTQLDESFNLIVYLGDKKQIEVKGKGTVKIDTTQGNYRLLDDVYYAPKLEYNLLSVGKLMKKGYSLLFDDDRCTIKNKKNNSILMTVMVSNNNMFLVNASKNGSPVNAIHKKPSEGDDTTKLWHLSKPVTHLLSNHGEQQKNWN